MRTGQIVPRQWLIIADPDERRSLAIARSLPRGSGILIVAKLDDGKMRELRKTARLRGLTLVVESRGHATRVHNVRELSRAMLRRTPFILLSPLEATKTHPDWRPIPRMRAAALARLGGRRLIALGGMSARRYAALEPLGFIGWAGISAFRT